MDDLPVAARRVPARVALLVAASVVVTGYLLGTVGGTVVALAVVIAAWSRRDRGITVGWLTGATALATVMVQTAFVAQIAYLERAVDGSYGWAGLLVIYTVPATAVAVGAWVGVWLRARGHGWATVAVACVLAVVVAVGSVAVGTVLGTAVADRAG